jgi:hypothetical protein
VSSGRGDWPQRVFWQLALERSSRCIGGIHEWAGER